MDKIEYIKEHISKPIVFIGMMGVGKTHICREMSLVFNVDFVDADIEIEKASAMTIPEIFERFGEEYFRDGEKRIIKRLIEENNFLISTGGGAVTTSDTLDLIKEKTISVWVNADADVIYKRISKNKNRPLLNLPDPKAKIDELMEARQSLYAQADITIRSEDGAGNGMKNDLIDKLFFVIREEIGR